ncbi:hypothetical protein E8P77_04685 [Soehngenia saccharolytica]|nr:hypothetical protein E8P77_04685 [Soehngenia saccharolytica]
MFFQSKIDRAFKWLNEKNNKDESSEENEDIELEKMDILAIIISAIIVFLPIFIVLGLIIFFVLKL